jgi:hypothetical protein
VSPITFLNLFFKGRINDASSSYFPNIIMANPKVFMDVAIKGKGAGRMVFELFKDKVPLTAENFRALW